MRIDSATVIKATDPEVQRVGTDALQFVYDELQRSYISLYPGPVGSPDVVYDWCIKAKDVYNHLFGVRDLLDDASRRKEKVHAAPFAICVPTFGQVSIYFMMRLMGLAAPMSSSM